MTDKCNKNFLSVLLLVIMMHASGIIFAQEVSTRWGKPFTSSLLTRGYYVLSISADGMTILTKVAGNSRSASQIAISRFDGTLSYRDTKKLQLKLDDKDLDLEFIVNLRKHILVLSSFVNSKTLKRALFYQEFDPVKLDFLQAPRLLMEVEFDDKPFTTSGAFYHALSSDSSKLVVVYNPPSGSKSKEKFSMTVMNEDLEIIYRHSEEFAFKDKDYTLKNIIVSNAGQVCFSGKYMTGPQTPGKKDPNYSYMLLLFNHTAENAREITVELGDDYITDMRIGVTSDNKLLAAGYYSGKGTSGISGSFCMLINAESGELLHKSKKEFPLDLITTGMNERQADKITEKTARGKEVEMENYKLDKLVLRSDGGAVLVGEQNYSRTYSTYNTFNGLWSYYTTYYANDIILAGIDSTGTIDVTKKVLKLQNADTPDILSYVMVASGNDLYFIFTDNVLNLAPHSIKTEWADFGRKGITSLVAIYEANQMTRQKLYSFDSEPWYVVPGLSLPLDDSSVLLCSVNKSRTRFCLVYLD